MGGCRLFYFVKSKNGTINARILLFYGVSVYVNTFILLYFLRLQEGGGYSPLSHPPKSATVFSRCLLILLSTCASGHHLYHSECT